MTRVAAIDCGTNSIRLLIADLEVGHHGPVLHDVVRQMRIVRLGQGVDATGSFDPQALERTYAAIEEYAALIKEHGASKTRFVATSATRDAKNRHEFIAAVRERLGVDPEVVSGDEEAALSFAGALSISPPAPGSTVLVVDLGGGSTEFVLGGAHGPVAARSMDMGCVRLTERFWGQDMPTPSSIALARAEINHVLDEAATDIDFSAVDRLIGVAGTITTLTAAALDLAQYDSQKINGAEISFEKLAESIEKILTMDRETRASLGFMHPGRVDVIAAGALIYGCILQRVYQASHGKICSATASEHDILDGIALSLGA